MYFPTSATILGISIGMNIIKIQTSTGERMVTVKITTIFHH